MIVVYVLPLVVSLLFTLYFIHKAIFVDKDPIVVRELLVVLIFMVVPGLNIVYAVTSIYIVCRDSTVLQRFLDKRVL